MLKNHAAGERVRHSASERNAWTDAARFAQATRGNLSEEPQRVARHSGVIHIKLTANVDIPRFGFAKIKEPLSIPDDTTWDDDLRDEMLGRFCFKADVIDGDEKWYSLHNRYRHAVILQAPYNYQDEILVPAVACGLSWCKIGYSDPGEHKYNLHPTTCTPTNGSTASAGGVVAPGPFKIKWMEEDDNDDGFRWAWVDVCNEYTMPSPVFAVLEEDAAIDETKTLVLMSGLPDTDSIDVEFKLFEASNGDIIECTWFPQLLKWQATGVKCPVTGP